MLLNNDFEVKQTNCQYFDDDISAFRFYPKIDGMPMQYRCTNMPSLTTMERLGTEVSIIMGLSSATGMLSGDFQVGNSLGLVLF